jgi:hypothetical protein
MFSHWGSRKPFRVGKTNITYLTKMQTLNNTDVQLTEGLFITEMEDRLETVEFATAATNSICRDTEVAAH